MIKLYDYPRSSACYRVRIALALKGIPYDAVKVNLLERDQQKSAYRVANPQGLVPTLVIDGMKITQSLAIMDYLDSRFPDPRLVPKEPAARARVLSVALAIACDIHPLNNLRVLRYLDGMGHDQDRRDEWYRHWVTEGFAGLEAMLATSPETGCFVHGDKPGIADACIVPQMYNARRLEIDLAAYPTLSRIDAEATAHPAFMRAHPDNASD